MSHYYGLQQKPLFKSKTYKVELNLSSAQFEYELYKLYKRGEYKKIYLYINKSKKKFTDRLINHDVVIETRLFVNLLFYLIARTLHFMHRLVHRRSGCRLRMGVVIEV